MGGRKIAIINDADCFNDEGTNSLLKTLEEPPPRGADYHDRQQFGSHLPTIRSRSQIIRFEALSTEHVATVLRDQELLEDPQQADRLARISDGSVTRALELADPELWVYRDQLLNTLTKLPVNNVALSKELAEFIDSARQGIRAATQSLEMAGRLRGNLLPRLGKGPDRSAARKRRHAEVRSDRFASTELEHRQPDYSRRAIARNDRCRLICTSIRICRSKPGWNRSARLSHRRYSPRNDSDDSLSLSKIRLSFQDRAIGVHHEIFLGE